MNTVPCPTLEQSSKKNDVAKFDILGNLPNEVSYKILMRLTPKDIINLFNCSKKWHRQMNYDYFWKSKFLNDYGAINEETENKFYSKFIKKFPSLWQGRYLYKYGLQFNFENNNSKHIIAPSERNHDEPLKMVHFDDRRCIFYVVNKKKLYVADSRSGRTETVFKHSSAIESVIKHRDLVISLSKNNSILKVWNIIDGECLIDKHIGILHRLHNPQDSKIIGCKHLIIIINTAHYIPIVGPCLFDLETQRMRIIRGYTDAWCNDDIVAIARNDGCVQITDANFMKFISADCLSSTGTLLQIIMNNNYLVKVYLEEGSLSCNALVWNIKIKTHFNIPYRKNCKLISENKLICINGLARWELWNLDSQSCHFVFFNNVDQVAWNNSYLFTTVVAVSLHDMRHNVDVNILCLKTGRSWLGFRLLRSLEHKIMATEKKLVLANSIYYNKIKETKFSFEIFDFEANIKNHLKETYNNL